MFDLIIKNARIVDGTGKPAYDGDIVVNQGMISSITAMGEAGTDARRVIDALGRVVTPGFVDAHTHLDGQLMWDPLGTPACWHGITTVLIGHCGVTFAPVKPEDREAIAAMLETVEDIPRAAIQQAFVWNWQTYGDYLKAIEAQPKGVNVGGLMGHAAVRYFAMGDKSLDKDVNPTQAELKIMTDLLDEAIKAGALGFSTSRTLTHQAPDGRPIPGTFAEFGELDAFAKVLAENGKGVFQLIPRFMEGEKDFENLPQMVEELQWMFQASRTYERPVVFSLFTHKALKNVHRKILAKFDEFAEQGGNVRLMTGLRVGTVLTSLRNFSPVTSRHPAWKELYNLPWHLRVDAIQDLVWQNRLGTDDEGLNDYLARELYLFGPEKCEYERHESRRVGFIAESEGIRPIDVLIQRMAATHGEQIFCFSTNNHNYDVIEEILEHPKSLMGLGDAGAHVGFITDASSTTYALTHWHQEKNKFSLEETIRRMTSDTAEAFGIKDRGRLEVGFAADINIISLSDLKIELPEYVHDFPCGAGRWTQKARGYDYTIVNGEIFVEGGNFTGKLAGQVVRAS